MDHVNNGEAATGREDSGSPICRRGHRVEVRALDRMNSTGQKLIREVGKPVV